MTEKDYFLPTNDYVFKRIFGYVGNEKITKALLNAILDERVTKVDLDKNPITEKDLYDDKVGILDVRTTFNDQIDCDIEMQVTMQKEIAERILFYWSKMYVKNIHQGGNYADLKRTIVILITDFEMENLSKITKGHTEWKVREKDFQNIVLTDVLELHIIEISKLKKYADKTEQKDLLHWVEFLANPEKIGGIKMEDTENDEALRKALEVYEDLSKDEHERYLAELRMKHILDSRALKNEGYENGVRDGMEKGRKEGKIEGAKQNTLKIANEMLKEGESIEKIIRYTGLTKEEIEEIKKNNSDYKDR